MQFYLRYAHSAGLARPGVHTFTKAGSPRKTVRFRMADYASLLWSDLFFFFSVKKSVIFPDKKAL